MLRTRDRSAGRGIRCAFVCTSLQLHDVDKVALILRNVVQVFACQARARFGHNALRAALDRLCYTAGFHADGATCSIAGHERHGVDYKELEPVPRRLHLVYARRQIFELKGPAGIAGYALLCM